MTTPRPSLGPVECMVNDCDCAQHRWNGAPSMLRSDPPSTCECGHMTSKHRFREQPEPTSPRSETR